MDTWGNEWSCDLISFVLCYFVMANISVPLCLTWGVRLVMIEQSILWCLSLRILLHVSMDGFPVGSWHLGVGRFNHLWTQHLDDDAFFITHAACLRLHCFGACHWYLPWSWKLWTLRQSSSDFWKRCVWLHRNLHQRFTMLRLWGIFI